MYTTFVIWLPFAALATRDILASESFTFMKEEVIAKVRICGSGPYTVMLDTGTAPSVIDLALARKLGIKTEAAGQPGSGGGTDKAQSYVANLPDLEVDRLTFRNVNCLAMDLSSIGKRLGQHLDAILGDSVFDGHVVQFDYVHRVVRFLRKDDGSSGARFRFTHSDNEIHFNGVRINDRKMTGNLDTGSNSSFQLTPRGIRRLHLMSVAKSGTVHQSTGFNGAYKTYEGKVDRIDVGPIHNSAPEVTFWSPGTGHDDCHFDVNIGNGFWGAYVVTIDYIHHHIRVSSR